MALVGASGLGVVIGWLWVLRGKNVAPYARQLAAGAVCSALLVAMDWGIADQGAVLASLAGLFLGFATHLLMRAAIARITKLPEPAEGEF